MPWESAAFGTGSQRGEPIDDLKLIEWDGRDVVIIPDSDVFQRQDLLRAVYALGRELRERGASVSVAIFSNRDKRKLDLMTTL